jgi:hypothetical protein
MQRPAKLRLKALSILSLKDRKRMLIFRDFIEGNSNFFSGDLKGIDNGICDLLDQFFLLFWGSSLENINLDNWHLGLLSVLKISFMANERSIPADIGASEEGFSHSGPSSPELSI